MSYELIKAVNESVQALRAIADDMQRPDGDDPTVAAGNLLDRYAALLRVIAERLAGTAAASERGRSMLPQTPTSPAEREALHQQLADQARALTSRYQIGGSAAVEAEIKQLILRCPFSDINAGLWAALDRTAGQDKGT